MNAITNHGLSDVPTVFGTPWQGGYFAGILTFDGDVYAQVVAPKTGGEHAPAVWHPKYTEIDGAGSFYDGLANTRAMAKAGSKIAEWAIALEIGGFDDWHIPARDQLELLYRAFKPTAGENWVYRNGDNPSSLPVGYPYSKLLPGQTANELFREGGSEAFLNSWYWSSTQYSDGGAWSQSFGGGDQGGAGEGSKGRVRAVRRLKIS